MLSYQHSYHAGNPADVHKHIALVAILERLRIKPAPFCYVDAHAGRGRYDLDSDAALKTAEADRGIRRIRHAGAAPRLVENYLGLVAAANEPETLRWYPGSAGLAAALLRPHDRAVLIEQHPREVEALRAGFGSDPRIAIHARDSAEGLPALLPPPARRGLVLLDPSYERKDEFESIVDLLRRAFDQFANGIFLLWYPLLAAGRDRLLRRRLGELALPKTLLSELTFAPDSAGLRGSGIAIVNTPWQLEAGLDEAMQYVTACLAGDGSAYRQSWLGGQ